MCIQTAWIRKSLRVSEPQLRSFCKKHGAEAWAQAQPAAGLACPWFRTSPQASRFTFQKLRPHEGHLIYIFCPGFFQLPYSLLGPTRLQGSHRLLLPQRQIDIDSWCKREVSWKAQTFLGGLLVLVICLCDDSTTGSFSISHTFLSYLQVC